MVNKMKSLIKIVLSLVVLAGFGAGGYYIYENVIEQPVEIKAPKTASHKDAAKSSSSEKSSSSVKSKKSVVNSTSSADTSNTEGLSRSKSNTTNHSTETNLAYNYDLSRLSGDEELDLFDAIRGGNDALAEQYNVDIDYDYNLDGMNLVDTKGIKFQTAKEADGEIINNDGNLTAKSHIIVGSMSVTSSENFMIYIYTYTGDLYVSTDASPFEPAKSDNPYLQVFNNSINSSDEYSAARLTSN